MASNIEASRTVGYIRDSKKLIKGAKKGTAYAAQVAAETVVRKGMDSGLREVYIFSRGPGSGKEAAIRTINNLGVRIKLIKDQTPVAHNGCRPKGRRRV